MTSFPSNLKGPVSYWVESRRVCVFAYRFHMMCRSPCACLVRNGLGTLSSGTCSGNFWEFSRQMKSEISSAAAQGLVVVT
jgi:hypothetical protein